MKYFKYIFYLAVFAVIFYFAFSFIDPDFGWHLVTGNMILKSGFPITDPFSYTMPSFPFIEHEWLVDVVFSKLFPSVGLAGISVLFATLFVLAVYVSVSKADKLKITLFIIGISSLLQFFTISPKVFSWLLFSVFIYFVFNQTFWKKYWFSIPLFIILWTNLHGSYPEALVILLVVMVCKSFKEKHIWIKGVLVTFLSFLATLINPYGIRLWHIVWMTISDPLIKFRIAEWQPTYTNLFGFSFLTVFLITISVIFIWRYRHKFKIEQIILNLILFVQAMMAVRNVTFWVLFDIPMVAVALNYYFAEVKKNKEGEKRFSTISKGAFILVFSVFVFQCVTFIYSRSSIYKEDVFYPKNATAYLKENLPIGQIFSEYNWGGYLVWKMPEKKVFINGMMPIWRWKESPDNESSNAMNDYMGVLDGTTPYRSVFEKYNIDTVLLALPVEKNSIEKFMEKIELSLRISKKTDPEYLLYKQLEKDGWTRVYLDSSSYIYKKPQ